MFKPRPGQIEVLSYTNGRMGISAVPGSGKTHTLSCLASQLVADPRLQEDQEVLIVTLVNSAVQNFSSRIAAFINEKGLLPNLGYRVRTLHGLAHVGDEHVGLVPQQVRQQFGGRPEDLAAAHRRSEPVDGSQRRAPPVVSINWSKPSSSSSARPSC